MISKLKFEGEDMNDEQLGFVKQRYSDMFFSNELSRLFKLPSPAAAISLAATILREYDKVCSVHCLETPGRFGIHNTRAGGRGNT
jgi:hypothetical protein